MGLFDTFFGRKNNRDKGDEKPLPWISLTDAGQLEEISLKSHTRTQMIFKHSTTCGISRMVFNRFGKDLGQEREDMDFHYLDLHQFREVSNAVADRFQVRHQSPQLLVLKNGEVVAHESHGGILQMDLEKYS